MCEKASPYFLRCEGGGVFFPGFWATRRQKQKKRAPLVVDGTRYPPVASRRGHRGASGVARDLDCMLVPPATAAPSNYLWGSSSSVSLNFDVSEGCYQTEVGPASYLRRIFSLSYGIPGTGTQ